MKVPRTKAPVKPAPPTRTPTWQKVPIDLLIVDDRYQREIKESHVERICKEWDEAILNVLEVSKRGEDEYAVFDGQQRREAALRRGDITELPCLVHTGLTPEQEAELFTRLQDGRIAMHPLDRFKARVFAKDPTAVAITEIAKNNGYEIAFGDKKIGAIWTIERIYQRGNLSETLAMLSMWRGEKDALATAMLDGMSRFLEYYPDADYEHAREEWGNYGPKVILRRTPEFMENPQSSKPLAVLEVLRDIYVDRAHKLPTTFNAIEAKRNAIALARRTYKRVTYTDFRDAVLELQDFSVEEMMEKLGVSRNALTKRGEGFLSTAIERGTVKRYQPDGPHTKRRYAYVPVDRQKGPRRRPRGSDNGTVETEIQAPPARTRGPVKGTGKVTKASNPDIRQLIDEAKAGGAAAERVASGHWQITQDGLPKILISNSPRSARSVAQDRARLRRAGYSV